MVSVRDFGARGDGKTDDTQALHHALQRGDGQLLFPRGDYVISQPLHVPLEMHGRVAIAGQGGTARLIMQGPGPAIHLIGSHSKTALPADFDNKVWLRERFPTISGIEILGAHARADGIRSEGVMQPTFDHVLIRRCRHGIHLTRRDRNVLITNCHIYDNSGIGIFLDRVNLHQIIIEGSHISYCKQAGLKVAASEVRNIQICGNDIEYNFDSKLNDCADVFLDCREGTVREGTLVGNTVQARSSPGGANVRLEGVGKHKPNAVGLFTISGNLIGSQETAILLRASRGVVVAGNSIYSGYRRSLVIEDAEHIVVSGNSIDHNPEYRGKSTDQMILTRSRNVNLHGLIQQHTLDSEGEVEASVLLQDCENVNVTGCQFLGVRKRGLLVRGCKVLRLADCTIRPREGDRSFHSAIEVDEKSSSVLVVNNFLARGSVGDLLLPKNAGTATGNLSL